MKVGSLSELRSVLQEKIDVALLTDTAETVTDVMLEHIVSDVYEEYIPTTYKRRYNNGGLADPDNIITYLDEYGRLYVEQFTLGDKYYKMGDYILISSNYGKPIADIIETGEGYDIVSPGARPFLHNTREDLRKNKQHVSALKKGLKKQGLEVK